MSLFPPAENHGVSDSVSGQSRRRRRLVDVALVVLCGLGIGLMHMGKLGPDTMDMPSTSDRRPSSRLRDGFTTYAKREMKQTRKEQRAEVI